MIRSDDKNTDKKNYLTGTRSGARGNSKRLHREYFKSRLRNDFSMSFSVRYSFFSNRIVPIWNSFPDYVATSSTLNTFKSALDRYYKEFGCYNPKGVGFQT